MDEIKTPKNMAATDVMAGNERIKLLKLPVGGNGDLVLKCLSYMTWD